MKLELVYLPNGKYCVYPRMVYRLDIVIPPPPPPFWMTENEFDRTSLHFRAIRNFDLFFTKWLPAAILDDQSHFSPFQINTQFFILFTKWLPATILDDRKSLSIAFLAISDQYATFFFKFLQNGFRRPFLIRKSLSRISHFQINAQLFFFHKMAAGGHFG